MQLKENKSKHKHPSQSSKKDMKTFLCMQNRLIAGLMAVLILSSCTSIFGDHRNSLASDSANVDYSAGATSAEIKFHRPGEAVDSTETLTWSPNNLSEYATIQFTILVHNLPMEIISKRLISLVAG